MTSFEMLNLSEFDPEQDLVIMYVDVGKMTADRAKRYLDSVKVSVKPLFDKRGFEVLFLPIRDGMPSALVDVVSKVREQIRAEPNNYDEAMAVLGENT